MMTLVKYEIKKIFGQAKGFLITTVIMGLFFLLSGNFILRRQLVTAHESSWLWEAMSTVSFIGLGALMLIFFFGPVVASIMSYQKDLNGQHAVFETYIPHNGWKRIGAKYMSYLLLIFSGIALSALFAWLTFLVVRGAFTGQVSFDVDPTIVALLDKLKMNKLSAIFESAKYFAGIVLSLTLSTTFFTFFITLYSALRHHTRIAKAITLSAAAFSGIALSWITDRLFIGAGPLSGQLFTIATETYFSFALSVVALVIMGWMLEYKTELR